MIRRFVAVGTVAGLSLVASSSSAADPGAASLGQQGQFIFSADRLFDVFAYGNNKFHPDNSSNADTTVQGTSLGLFGGTSAAFGGLTGTSFGTVYNIPRFGFDYTIINNLTIGGDLLLFFSLGGSTHTDPTPTSTDLPSANVFGIFPHVGYIYGVNDLLSFWLRGGLHFWNAQINGRCGAIGTPSTNAHAFGIDLDPSIVISPVRHFAFFAGPALDWGFLGGTSTTTFDNPPMCNMTTTTNNGLTSLNFSLSAGLLGWL
jgi:hypothetical protein